MVKFSLSPEYTNSRGQKRQVKDLMNRVAAQTGQTTRELFLDVMKLWVADLTRETYPKQRSDGVKNVTVDALKLFSAIEDFDRPELKDSFRKGKDFDIGNLLFRPKMSSDEIANEVRQARDRRGRVLGNRRWSANTRRTVVKKRALNRFIRAQIARVGRLKAGWRKAADKYGIAVPGWVQKHGSGESDAYGDINLKTLDGELTAENRVPYASQKLGGSFMDFLLSKRMRDLQQGTYAKRWQKKMEKMQA